MAMAKYWIYIELLSPKFHVVYKLKNNSQNCKSILLTTCTPGFDSEKKNYTFKISHEDGFFRASKEQRFVFPKQRMSVYVL